MKKQTVFSCESGFLEAQVILAGRRQAVIENYRSIQSYTTEEITVLTPSGRIRICGKNLEIPFYTSLEMCVRGQIENMILEEGRKK